MRKIDNNNNKKNKNQNSYKNKLNQILRDGIKNNIQNKKI